MLSTKSLKELSRARLYETLARLLDAGFHGEALIASLEGSRTDSAWSPALTALRKAYSSGASLSESLAPLSPRDIPPTHLQILRAAETAGQLPSYLRQLAKMDQHLARDRKELLRLAAYPTLLLHMAVIASYATLLVTEPVVFTLKVVVILLPLDLLLYFCWAHFVRTLRPLTAPKKMSRIPFLRQLMLARYYHVYFGNLHLLYEAGIALPKAANDSLAVIAPQDLSNQMNEALDPLRQNEPLGMATAGFPGLNQEIQGMITTSEQAGELGAALLQATTFYDEEETQRQTRLVKFLGSAFYAVAVCWVVYAIISFYGGYYSALGSLSR